MQHTYGCTEYAAFDVFLFLVQVLSKQGMVRHEHIPASNVACEHTGLTV